MLTRLQTLFEELPDRIKTARHQQARPILTKKRSAPAPKTGPVPIPVHQMSQARRSEDLEHSSREQLRQISQRMSFDAAVRQQHGGRPGQQQQQFMSKFPDLLPLDLSPATGSPESSGTPSTSHRSAASFQTQQQQQQTPMSSASHLYKLDAMMFPSTDPFAYPNRPMMEFNLQQQQHQHQQTSHGGGGHQGQDEMQFYVSNIYEDIEGQLLGPIPPYLMQSSQAQGLDLSSQMYTASSLLTLQQAQARQAHQRQQRELEELLADPNFDVFPHSFQQL